MNFLNKITALLPIGKKEENLEYFFALNIAIETITCSLWTIEGNLLKILGVSSDKYTSLEDLATKTDRLLDEVLGPRQIDPQKILFGVPNSWLIDESLKEDKLKFLRDLVKDLELSPMAYVESSHALIHFLEKTEGLPPTAVIVGFEKHHLTVTVVRAGKIDGVKIIQRGENSGVDIEKVLLTFTQVETLPSKILVHGLDSEQLKHQLLSYPWMSKLSFLHLPKIENMSEEIEIKSVCFAGGSEINPNVTYSEKNISKDAQKSILLSPNHPKDLKEEEEVTSMPQKDEIESKEDLGFMVGDIATAVKEEPEEKNLEQTAVEETAYLPQDTNLVEVDDFENEMPVPVEGKAVASSKPIIDSAKWTSRLKRFIPKKNRKTTILGGIVAVFAILVLAFLFIPKADVKIYVEPKVLENDATVTADPNQKSVDENNKIIPGQVVAVDISGTAKDTATGKKEVGDPAKGTIKIINNSSDPQSFSQGSTISANNIKFTLDSSVQIASTSATADSKSTQTVSVTASSVGADGNLPSGTQFSGLSSSVAIVAEGNFSGGTSKTVTVVSSDDQQRLLAKLSSDLRLQAQQKLQDQYKNLKILEEALSENISQKSYSKNINDQASDFSLNLSIHYIGTAFNDADLRTIVSKLVNTQVPDGFQLDLANTETQADVSKLEKDGKLIFLAKFKANLMPKIDTDKIKSQIKGKNLNDALNIIKGVDNVLGAEIKITPSIPGLQILPILTKNIKVEVGLK